jgi:hypothetical protein
MTKILENEIAKLATLILKDGDRFCGKPSKRRTSAILMAKDAIENGLTVSVISTQQVESRKSITIQEVEDFLN